MIKEKLERYFNGTCTLEERTEVLNWLADEKNKEATIAYIESKWLVFDESADANKSRAQKWYKRRWIQLAACIAIVFVTGALFLGKKQNSRGTLIVVETEMGERKWVRLGDGSEVYLNANTRLVYPSGPVLTQAVYVEGEAFFKMAQNNKPLRIQSGDIETVVTASTFNISAFPRDSTVILAVNKGNAEIRSTDSLMPLMKLRIPIDTAQPQQADTLPLVKLRKAETTPLLKLRPAVTIDKNEYAIIHKQEKRVEVRPTKDERKLFGWKDGFMYFDNADTTQIANKLERWYGVRVEFCENTPKLPAYSAEFDNKNITDVLKQLSTFLHLNYKLDGKRVFLCPQKPG